MHPRMGPSPPFPALARCCRRHPAAVETSPTAEALPGDAGRILALASFGSFQDPVAPFPASARPHCRFTGN